jgi:hypothetical protein
MHPLLHCVSGENRPFQTIPVAGSSSMTRLALQIWRNVHLAGIWIAFRGKGHYSSWSICTSTMLIGLAIIGGQMMCPIKTSARSIDDADAVLHL